MIPREKVVELVEAHARLEEDPAVAAVWIRQGDPTVWLLEIIPSFEEAPRREEPIFFNPGAHFRFPLALIAGTRKSLELTLQSDPELARLVAAGEVLLDRDAEAAELVKYASRLAAA